METPTQQNFKMSEARSKVNQLFDEHQGVLEMEGVIDTPTTREACTQILYHSPNLEAIKQVDSFFLTSLLRAFKYGAHHIKCSRRSDGLVIERYMKASWFLVRPILPYWPVETHRYFMAIRRDTINLPGSE